MNLVTLRYTGYKPYRDRVLGLSWIPGMQQCVTAKAARTLLRFIEFQRVMPDDSSESAQSEMERVAAVVSQKEREQESEHDSKDAVLMTVADMDKAALEEMAALYEVRLDKRKSVQALRQEVAHLVELYGVR